MNETLKLYGIPGSHPCACVERGLQLKGLPYERVDFLPGFAPLVARAVFGRRTLPGLRMGDYRVVGSRLILRAIDGLAADPPLIPSDPDERARVEEAEEWGDRVLQDEARPISLWAMVANPEASVTFLADARRLRPPLPTWMVVRSGPLLFPVELRLLGYPRERLPELLDRLPVHLDHVDELISEGVIGDPDAPNVADLQIASSIAFLARFDDLRPLLDGRPGLELAEGLFRDYPGRLPRGALDVREPAPA